MIINITSIIIGVISSLLICFFSFKRKFLTKDGAIAAFILGFLIFGFGKLKWSIPLLTFFILSSVLSKYRKQKNFNIENYFEKTGIRDQYQVLANGGIGGLLIIINLFFNNELFYLMFVSFLSVACADTWGTEIGTLRKRKTFDILTFKKVKQGISGGISVIGLIGSLLGSFTIGLSSIYWINKTNFFIIIIVGFIGSLVDSIFGKIVQAQYKCLSCGITTEKKFHCQKSTERISGVSWINNDWVNFFSGLSGSLLFLLIFNFLR